MKVRKANGLKVAGGRRIGRILAFGIGAAVGLKGRIGCTGVANAGDDEGIGFEFVAGVAGGLKSGGAFDFVVGLRRAIFSVQFPRSSVFCRLNRSQSCIS